MKMENILDMNALSQHEKELIKKHLKFYESLDRGTKIPDTDAQRDFVAVCRKEKKANH